MASGWLRTCLVAGLAFYQVANGLAITAPPSHPTPVRRETSAPTNTACGLAASASSSYLSAKPEASSAVIDAELAYDCLNSVPNYHDPAIRLLNSLRTYVEFQSSKEILKKPPPGYLFPAVDIDYALDAIQEKVEAGEYESEYAFQTDLSTLFISAKDGHFYFSGDLLGAFTYARKAADLVAISSDGLETPEIYHVFDLVEVDRDTEIVTPVKGFKPSPVVKIDGVDVVTFLLKQSFARQLQDPDALWNDVFYQFGKTSATSFQAPGSYPGPHTNLTFANGTTATFPNVAIVNVDLKGVASGDAAYQVMCPGALKDENSAATTTTQSSPATSTATEVETGTAVPTSTSSPNIPYYPWPVIKHSADSVAGYYLNDTGLTDVAVLQVSEFLSQTDDSLNYEKEFQSVVQKFLDAAVKSKKKKLIIDLQRNGGGYIDLGTDLFAQLFPSMPPNSKSNMRAHLGLEILGNAASDNVTAAEKTADETDEDLAENQYTPLAFQTVVDPQLRPYPNFEAFFGPFPKNGGNYTGYFQNNYTDPNSSDFLGQGIIITGTNDRTGFRQPFAPQDIIVLYDGYCGSTCTVFSEYLKSYAGIQFISVGGRPQTGPMQAIGGVKGSQIFPFASTIYGSWVQLWKSTNNAFRDSVNGTIWEYFNGEPVLRSSAGGVNGRNHYRIGDKTETPLHFVYEASDCRIWWTREMLSDPTFLWSRVANIAFKERKGTQFNSKYCVKDSTGHPTSISGGWKKGTLGPQDPPKNALASAKGWQLGSPSLNLNVTEVGSGKSVDDDDDDAGSSLSSNGTTSSGGGTDIESNSVTDAEPAEGAELKSLTDACHGYKGDAWFVELVCGALDHLPGKKHR